MKDLEEHSCDTREDSPLKDEGITVRKWAQIEDMRKLPKDSRPQTDVEKWNMIWAILFPGIRKPAPCMFYFDMIIHFRKTIARLAERLD